MNDFDPIAAIEAAYRLDVSPKQWMSGMLQTVRGEWDRGFGVGMFEIRLDEDGQPDIGTIVYEGELEEGFSQAVRGMNASLDQTQVELTYRRPRVVGTLSERMKPVLDDFREDPIYQEYGHPLGIYDCLGLRIADPSGTMFILAAPLGDIYQTTVAERERWSRIAAHIAAAYRLRERGLPRGIESDDVNAIFSPEGELVHLDTSFDDSDGSREGLERAAEAIGRARAGIRRSQPERALRLWRALFEGRYSLVEHVDTDDRRFLLARSNEPCAEAPEMLDQRARQVAQFAAMGHSDELIAYELGLEEETVESILRTALSTLNLESRDELARLWQTLNAGEARPL